MHAIPPTYLDRGSTEHLDGRPVRIGQDTYATGVIPVPGGRNSTPNPAYDGGRGYQPVGAVGRPTSGLRCEGNSSCIPICPAQAKYNALKTLELARGRTAPRGDHAGRGQQGVGRRRPTQVTGVEYLRWTGDTSPPRCRTRAPRVATCWPPTRWRTPSCC